MSKPSHLCQRNGFSRSARDNLEAISVRLGESACRSDGSFFAAYPRSPWRNAARAIPQCSAQARKRIGNQSRLLIYYQRGRAAAGQLVIWRRSADRAGHSGETLILVIADQDPRIWKIRGRENRHSIVRDRRRLTVCHRRACAADHVIFESGRQCEENFSSVIGGFWRKHSVKRRVRSERIRTQIMKPFKPRCETHEPERRAGNDRGLQKFSAADVEHA